MNELAPDVGMPRACEVLGVPTSTGYRWRQPPQFGPRRPRPPSPRALGEAERKEVLDLLCSERFVNKAPATVYAELMDEDQRYLCSPRTMYRILESKKATRERRDQARHPKFKRPELVATAPNQVWTWDVTWLRGAQRYVYYPLYVIIDLYSRYNPGWMLAHEESGDLAAKLIRETCTRQGIDPETLTLHADRGPVPTGKTVQQLLIDLDITRSLSRPRVSNDNPFSEAEFRTLKYQPDFPDRFDDYDHARSHCDEFFGWYNDEHRHSGIAYLTPSTVHYGRAPEILARRQATLDAAFAVNPQRFVAGPPSAPALPSAVWINPPEDKSKFDIVTP